MKHKILYLFAALAMFTACSDDLEDQAFTISEEFPAATWLEKDSLQRFTQWVSLLKNTELFSTMNLNAGDYTLFVPDDNAMNAYLSENGYASVLDIDTAYGKVLVKYHTIAKEQYSQVDFANDVLPDTTATGDRLTVTFDENGNYFVNNDARITHFDIVTTNATIFVIDKVLSPITEYLFDRLENEPEWSIFRDLCVATGIDSLLKEPEVGRASSFTLFVVPNTAFANENIADLKALADSLGAGQDRAAWKQPENAMYRYAAYHLLSSSRSTNDLFATEYDEEDANVGTIGDLRTIETRAEAAYLEFQDREGVAYINYDAASATGVLLGDVTNMPCKNGVIHTVDAPLYIKAPSKIPTVTWELTDYDILRREIPEFGLSSLVIAETYPFDELIEKYGENFCYQWTTVTGSLSPVYYEVGASTDSVGVHFKNHDALVLNLGQYGYVDMESPTILADSTTYYVGMSFYNTYGLEPGGRLSLYIDDEMVGTIFTRGGVPPASRFPSSKYSNTDVTKLPYPEQWVAVPKVDQKKPANNEYIVGEVTFAKTGKHTLRIEDNQGAQVRVDYISFTPKK